MSAALPPSRATTLTSGFRKGEIIREALGVLRVAGAPLSTKEIAERLLAQRGMTEPPVKVVRDMIGALHRLLCPTFPVCPGTVLP
jgi:hypothetical protein